MMFDRQVVTGRVAAVLFVALLGTSQQARADAWVLDRQYTEIRFSWDHLGLSRKSARFLEFDGQLEFTPTDPVGGEIAVIIKAASLASGVRDFDALLRSTDFFDVAKHPVIKFTSTGVRKTGEKTGELVGELTMLGITRPVTLSATWNFTGEHPMSSVNPTYQGKWVSGFSATAKVLRSDWGLKRGVPLISDEIEIVIEAEFLRQDATVR